jgi:hypothetical protein
VVFFFAAYPTFSHPDPVPAVQNRTAHKSTPQSPFFWDFWPDGELKFLVSSQDLRDTNNLATNWVLETTRSNGSTRAPIWDKGHETRKQCVGIIRCHDSTCSMRLAPALRAVERHKQLQQTCILCGETLCLAPCGIESSLFRFRDGIIFIHSGSHNHSMFTHSSVQNPDGSLAFMDYLPKYELSSLNSTATPITVSGRRNFLMESRIETRVPPVPT